MMHLPHPDRGNSTHRDLRIDLLRGLVLVLVLIDHIEMVAGVKLLSGWTLVGIGYSDASDGFVCLSGIAFGIAYTKRLARHGLASTLRHAMRRAIQIIAAYLGLVAILVLTCHVVSEPPHMLLAVARGFPTVGSELLLQTATLQYHPFGLSILVLYAVLLPAMPLWLWLWERLPVLAICISFWIYQWAQWQFMQHRGIWLFSPLTEFNPAGWQFLYCIAAAIGSGMCPSDLPKKTLHTNGLTSPFQSVMQFRLMITVPVIVLTVVFILRKVVPYEDSLVNETGLGWLMRWTKQEPPWGHRSAWQPIRALHFVCLALLSASCFPSSKFIAQTSNLGWLLVIGQNSLIVYASSLILTCGAIFLFDLVGTRSIIVFVVEFLAIRLMLRIARLLGR